jgi:hypothetical protein
MDPFLPIHEPARTIYMAFKEEASKRKTRPGLEWIELERKAVHAAACMYARDRGLKEPTLEDVESAERYACGSVDYGAKWAHALARTMMNPDNEQSFRYPRAARDAPA